MPDRDPVARVLGAGEDLYDVAEWDRRSVIDYLSVVIYTVLHGIRRYALLGLALVLFVVQLAFAGFLVLEETYLGILSALSVVPALLVMGYVWWGDPTRREPPELLAITFVLAVVFASIAALVNSVFGAFLQAIPVVGMALFFFLVVGPIEETVKWLAIRTHAYHDESFSAVIDGAVYGAVAGFGFATIENVLYIAQGYLGAAGSAQLETAFGVATSRFFAGPGHVLYSSIAGYYLGLAKFNPENAGPIAVKGILIAALIHASYNTLVTYLPLSGLAVLGSIIVFDILVGYYLYRKLSRYRNYYHRADEVNPQREADGAHVDD